MKIYLLTVGHRQGQGVSAHLSMGERLAGLAKWARDNWGDRPRNDQDGDHTQYDDNAVIDRYFEDHDKDWYSFDEDDLPDPQIVVDIEGAIVTLTADQKMRALVKHYDADSFYVEALSPLPEQVQMQFEIHGDGHDQQS